MPGSAITTWATPGCEVNGRNARRSIGTPRMGRNCFGSPGPARTPAPAATMTTPASGGEAAGEIMHSFETDQVEPRGFHARAGRQEDAPETLALRLDQPAFHAGDRPDLATQPDLTEEQGI